jgi:transposase
MTTSATGPRPCFAALDVLSGRVIGECMPRHRHTEFLAFLKTIDREVPKRLKVHLVLDNYAIHNHPRVRAWLERHPRFRLHFTPTSSSWLSMVEIFFSRLTEKAIRRGIFHSVPSLIAAIEEYLAAHNDDPQPFAWTATTDQILEKVRRGRVTLNTIAN